MFNKFITLSLMFTLLAFAGVKPIFSQSKNAEKRAKKTAKIRRGIKKLGAGEDAKIKVTTWNKTKVKGYIKATGEDDFTVVEKRTGNETTFKYSEIKKVSGKNIPLGIKILIGVGIALVAVTIIFEIVFHKVIDN